MSCGKGKQERKRERSEERNRREKRNQKRKERELERRKRRGGECEEEEKGGSFKCGETEEVINLKRLIPEL